MVKVNDKSNRLTSLVLLNDHKNIEIYIDKIINKIATLKKKRNIEFFIW